MATSRGVTNERDEKKYRRRNVPIMYRCSGCYTKYWVIWKLETGEWNFEMISGELWLKRKLTGKYSEIKYS